MSETTPATRKHSGEKSADRLAVCPILAKAQAQEVIANKQLYWDTFLYYFVSGPNCSPHRWEDWCSGGVRMQPGSLARFSKHLHQK